MNLERRNAFEEGTIAHNGKDKQHRRKNHGVRS
jgi:hypothetical protein